MKYRDWENIFSLKENSVNSWYILSEKFSSNISEGWPDIGTWPAGFGEIVTERIEGRKV